MKRLRLGTSLLLISATLTSNALAQKNQDVRLTTDPLGVAYSDLPQIATSGDSVYIAWNDSRNDTGDFRSNVFFNRSLNGGATWLTSTLQLNTVQPRPFQSASPQIAAVDQSVYVIWKDSRNAPSNLPFRNEIFFRGSQDGGTTWLASELRLDTAPPSSGGSTDPQIAASGDSVYVVWADAREVNHWFIHFNRSLDRGATWLPSDIRLDSTLPGTVVSFDPQIAASGDSVYVTWRNDRDGPHDIYFNRSLNRGATWLPTDIRMNTSPPGSAQSFKPQIAASGDSVYVAWMDHRSPTGTYFNRSLDRGTTWLSSDLKLSEDGGGGIPQIAASGDAVYVTWSSRRNGAGDIYFNRSLDSGTTWLASDTRLDTDGLGAGISGFPQLTGFRDSVHVIWEDERTGGEFHPDIYYNRSLDAGTSWLASDIRLNTNEAGSGNSRSPQVIASGDSIYTTWVDSRNNLFRGEVYFNIPFGAQPYGEGTRGSGDFIPRLDSTDSLNIGNTFTLTVSNGLGGAFGQLGFGGPNSKATIPSVGGGQLLIDPVDFVVPIFLDGVPGTPGAGTYTLNCQIPVDSAFLGLNLNFQAAFLDAGARDGITLTNGVEAWIL